MLSDSHSESLSFSDPCVHPRWWLPVGPRGCLSAGWKLPGTCLNKKKQSGHIQNQKIHLVVISILWPSKWVTETSMNMESSAEVIIMSIQRSKLKKSQRLRILRCHTWISYLHWMNAKAMKNMLWMILTICAIKKQVCTQLIIPCKKKKNFFFFKYNHQFCLFQHHCDLAK